MVNLDGIKNIIFDLGDVIININHNKAIEAFQKLLGNSFSEMEQHLIANKILEKYETTEITTDEFISFFKDFNSTLTNQEIIDAWNSMLLDIPKERTDLINSLTKDYRLFLLSNTNEIHIKYINNYVLEKFQMKSISVPFEKTYYSHELKMRKPNPKIFSTILSDKNLIAEETLFIDDSEEHIITAKQLNLKTHHLLETETIVDLFNVN